MSLSIITPHYNDLDSLKQVYFCLQKQIDSDWEWIIVDDLSDEIVRLDLRQYFEELGDNRLYLIMNEIKTNASVCRNIGADKSRYDHLVFLDSDDLIAFDFVKNRKLYFKNFTVFRNYEIQGESGERQIVQLNRNLQPLDMFLSAQFIWQTTCVLWEKEFFNTIGKFNPKLLRLQDVELFVRALQNCDDYINIDNTIDFYYQTRPIRHRKDLVKPVYESIYLFISELLDKYNLNEYQMKLLSGYYYLCTKYLERSGRFDDFYLVRKNLKMFYKKGHVGFFQHVLGRLTLKLYSKKVLSGKMFLRVNRYLFKP